jgi:hypothetical protein
MEAKGASTWTIQYCKYSILNSIFTTATLEDRVITFHPSRGVRTPSVPSTPRQIITPEQFDAIYQALPDAAAARRFTADEDGLPRREGVRILNPVSAGPPLGGGRCDPRRDRRKATRAGEAGAS